MWTPRKAQVRATTGAPMSSPLRRRFLDAERVGNEASSALSLDRDRPAEWRPIMTPADRGFGRDVHVTERIDHAAAVNLSIA